MVSSQFEPFLVLCDNEGRLKTFAQYWRYLYMKTALNKKHKNTCWLQSSSPPWTHGSVTQSDPAGRPHLTASPLSAPARCRLKRPGDPRRNPVSPGVRQLWSCFTRCWPTTLHVGVGPPHMETAAKRRRWKMCEKLTSHLTARFLWRLLQMHFLKTCFFDYRCEGLELHHSEVMNGNGFMDLFCFPSKGFLLKTNSLVPVWIQRKHMVYSHVFKCEEMKHSLPVSQKKIEVITCHWNQSSNVCL